MNLSETFGRVTEALRNSCYALRREARCSHYAAHPLPYLRRRYPSAEKELFLYYSPERPDGLRQRCIRPFGYTFEGRELTAFPQRDSIYSIRLPQLAAAAVLIHEDFHRYQLHHFGPTTGGRFSHPLEAAEDLPVDLVSSERFQELAALERQHLVRALQSRDVNALAIHVGEYLATRARRMELVPAELRENEAHEERKEGSAQYVAYKWLTSEWSHAGSLAGLIIADLLSTPNFIHRPEALRHWHIYATGAASGVLLDNLGMDWQSEVQGGATLVEMLLEAIGHRDGRG